MEKWHNVNMSDALEALICWYKASHRDLPWRKTSDPYKILVSEIMLQQTRVEAVIDRYISFIAFFPTASALADADMNDVLASWEGLGYYNRARNLKYACEVITYEKKGEFPQTASELLKLPGVGDYTSAAVASIACGEPVAVLDGNVFRVMSRLFQIAGDKNNTKVKADVMKKLHYAFLDYEDPGTSNQALMELGALVCLPVEPKCDHCPVSFTCEAYRNDTQKIYPMKTPKPVVEKIKLHLLLGCDQSGPLVLKAGWRGYQDGFFFPILTEVKESTTRIDQFLEKTWDIPFDQIRKLGIFSHPITRFKLNCTVYSLVGTSRDAYEKISPKSTILKKAIAFL